MYFFTPPLTLRTNSRFDIPIDIVTAPDGKSVLIYWIICPPALRYTESISNQSFYPGANSLPEGGANRGLQGRGGAGNKSTRYIFDRERSMVVLVYLLPRFFILNPKLFVVLPYRRQYQCFRHILGIDWSTI